MNEDKYLPYTILFLRLALAFTMLSSVADRFGFWGDTGDKGVRWGDWFNFAGYTHTVVPFVSRGFGEKIATASTLLEVTLALMLLFGFRVRWAAVGVFILSLLLAMALSITFGIKEVFNQQVFVTMAASLLLACMPVYKWTLNGIKKKTVYKHY